MTGPAEERYERLFTPLELGERELRNRIVFPAMITAFGAGNRVTDHTVAWYRARAAGGAGMVVSEALAVHPTSAPKPFALTAYGPGAASGLARVAQAVEREGSLMVGQLYHLGRSQLWTTDGARPMGPSALPDFYSGTVPRAMTHGDIDMITEAFAECAVTLAHAGFSGVELHAAHGHLLSLFLSPWSNVREDEYGNDTSGRTRFLREVIAAVRAAGGPGFVVGLKMPGDEGVPGGIRPADAAELFGRIQAETPVDYVCFAQGTIAPSFGDHVPDMHYPQTPYLDLQRGLRAAAGGVPVIAVGRIRTAAEAEATLRAGGGDLVALGRALVADPDLPRKARSEHRQPIRPYIHCNDCWGEVHAGRPAKCPVTPVHGPPGSRTAGARTRRITVVGGGFAGLEAARTAAERGHQVTLLAGEQLGGSLRLEARLPGRTDLNHLIAFQEETARQAGVQVVRAGRATPADVLATGPDTVVLATGARMVEPTALTADGTALSIRDYLLTPPAAVGRGTAVVVDQDGSAAVFALAELLAARHSRIVLLTPRLALAEAVPYTNRLGVHRRLATARVEVVQAASATACEAGRLHYEHVFTAERATVAGVGQVVWATPRVPDDSLAEPLRGQGVTVRLVGDALAPTTLLGARAQLDALAAGLGGE